MDRQELLAMPTNEQRAAEIVAGIEQLIVDWINYLAATNDATAREHFEGLKEGRALLREAIAAAIAAPTTST
jgi:hypothetical protein